MNNRKTLDTPILSFFPLGFWQWIIIINWLQNNPSESNGIKLNETLNEHSSNNRHSTIPSNNWWTIKPDTPILSFFPLGFRQWIQLLLKAYINVECNTKRIHSMLHALQYNFFFIKIKCSVKTPTYLKSWFFPLGFSSIN